MKKLLKVLTISMALAGILVAVLASTVLAGGPQGSGNGNNSIRIGGLTIDIVSQLLGLTSEQIQAERQAGKSLVQIAATRNVTEQALINAIIADRRADIQQQITAGTITQPQADQRLTQMTERVKIIVNRTSVGPPEWAGANSNGKNGNCNGLGANAQGGLNGNQSNCTGTAGSCDGTGKMQRAGRNTQ